MTYIRDDHLKKSIATTEQEMKPKGNGIDLINAVKDDLESRAEKGLETYGERLKPFNGRDALIDAYQEALDLCVYLRQAIEERDSNDSTTR